ncbi:MAG: histidinol-phosphatase HisJ family protein [Eubacteriales bacterium]|nr:histidinol-phosphatase HisJ family protein [Eubacteriales bacterium]
MLADYHVHTEFSDDSTYAMEEVVLDAIKLGLSEICFTDHVDYGIKRDWDSGPNIPYRGGKLLANVDYPLYADTIQELQYIYGDQISIKLGLEFGMQKHTISRYEQLFSKYPFDFVLLSVHEIGDEELWNHKFQKGYTQQEYNERYYQELLTLVRKYKHYSVLGHLDLIARYDPVGRYPFEKVQPMIEKILRQVIADGKGIEVNTSSHRYGLKDLTPCVDILKLYRDLGGKIITIGSDSHQKEHLGAYIAETMKVLKELGFAYFCTYERMEPRFHPMD